ncbi:protein IMPACT-B-like [Dreissena polymorpha]|uniref:RWD domain-containing protein n=1 Tax=Dreissena polymorpha TaxID=45954 RepID=A0A9D4E417_DREPO|nr:protein IMPACT-B-like [Dreissena polymorpha]KAH3772001.1 hypothetical protein DPMN_173332 [Dreissena polymorpha]
MSTEDNATQQRDEIEALSSIYGDEWCVVDEEHKIYCITVTDGQENSVWKVCFQVILPENYPSNSPPEYQLNAPWLRGEEKRNLEAALADLYCENIGLCIIYLWVEKIRELLQNKISIGHESGMNEGSTRQVTMTTEIDHGDDGFDIAFVEVTSETHSITLEETNSDWECPAIHHGECFSDRRSTFQPHLASVFHKSQIKKVLTSLLENKKIANATHNIFAYRIMQQQGSHSIVLQGCEDDGETHAGSRMLHLLQILDAQNVMVVVSRWYGGIHLGPDRFKHINNCTRTILETCGYIKDKEDKKGPKSVHEKKKR